MLFFLLTAFFRVLFERLYVHRGGDLMPLPFTLPRPLPKATPTTILACFSGFFASIDRELVFWGSQRVEVFVGVACGRDLCGHGPSEQSELGSRPQRSRPQGHTHKGLVPIEYPRRPILDR